MKAVLSMIFLLALANPALSRDRGDNRNEGPDRVVVVFKIEGVESHSEVPGYKDWFNISSFQWGAGRAISSPSRGKKERGHSGALPTAKGAVEEQVKREVSEASVSEISLTLSDLTPSIELFRSAFSKKSNKAMIRILKVDNRDVLSEYLISNVFVSGYSVSASGQGVNQSISLNYDKIQVSQPSDSKKSVYDLSSSTLTE